MKKPIAIGAVLALAAVSVALAAQPKPMACDAWLCKGTHCAPAKYAKQRSSPTVLPLFASPLYGAAVIEGGVGFGAVLLGAAWTRRRRAPSELSDRPAPAPRETGEL